jgi:hypothetical protein
MEMTGKPTITNLGDKIASPMPRPRQNQGSIQGGVPP